MVSQYCVVHLFSHKQNWASFLVYMFICVSFLWSYIFMSSVHFCTLVPLHRLFPLLRSHMNRPSLIKLPKLPPPTLLSHYLAWFFIAPISIWDCSLIDSYLIYVRMDYGSWMNEWIDLLALLTGMQVSWKLGSYLIRYCIFSPRLNAWHWLVLNE